MDEIVKKVAAFGLPGVVLVITMAATGLTGAAAISTALAIRLLFGHRKQTNRQIEHTIEKVVN